MGTVATYSDRARIKVADSARTNLLDGEVLGILNGILETIYQTLLSLGSDLVSEQLEGLTNYTSDDFPWRGIFNRAIERLLIVEMLEMQGKDVTLHFGFAQQELDRAMQTVYDRGIRQDRVSSDLFSVGGI